MIGVVLTGMLSSMAIPNCIAMMNRAKEGQTKANMHMVQLAAEDYGIAHAGKYPSADFEVVPFLPGGRRLPNAFTNQGTEPRTGEIPSNAPPGSVWYVPERDSTGDFHRYHVYGVGVDGQLRLALTSGY
jgi:type II secretory pathway pseudopilin PulG